MWLGLPGGLLKTGFTVVTPDNRGTGSSDAPFPPYTMSELADDLAAVIEDLRLGPALVAGISLGGMMAQQMSIRHPELVAGLVLAATTCGLPHGQAPSVEALRMLVQAALSDSPIERAMIQRRLAHPKSLERDPELFAPWAARA
jgi:pimeloyl-ACP methyl ester carboxylesterase